MTNAKHNRLLDAVQGERVPHAVILSGPEGSGRRELARRTAALYCTGEDKPERLANWPNYFEIGESNVKVEEIRGMLSFAALQGFEGGRRAFVLINAHRMSVQIQNTLLKTLEEPNPDTMLILTGNEFGLLPTIRSRCMIVRLGAAGVADAARDLAREGIPAEEARLFAALGDGVPGRARAFAAPDAQEFRAATLELLQKAMFEYSPFSDAANLVTISTAEPDVSDESPEEPPAKAGRKRKRGDAKRAENMFTIWESIFRDALVTGQDAGEAANGDWTALIAQIAARFTTAQIQGIIEMLANAQKKLAAGANVYLTIDAALAGLFCRDSANRR